MYLPKSKTPFLKGKSTKHGLQTCHGIKERKGVSWLTDKGRRVTSGGGTRSYLDVPRLGRCSIQTQNPQGWASLQGHSLPRPKQRSLSSNSFPIRWPGPAEDWGKESRFKAACSTSFHASLKWQQ